MRIIFGTDVCFLCGLYNTCSWRMAIVCMALEMSIIDKWLVRITCGFMKWWWM